MKNVIKLALLSVIIGILSSCTPEVETPVYGDYEKGIYILNQGVFGANGATISYFNPETNEVTDSIFYKVNARGLGDVLQSMVIVDNKAFVVLNNSLKVEVIDLTTFESLAVIAGEEITYPRYIVDGGNGKVYLSNGTFGGTVIAINVETFAIDHVIPVGNGPEKLYCKDNLLYVPNSGYYDAVNYTNVSDSTMSIIDLNTNTVSKLVQLEAKNPKAITSDDNDNIWVLCQGVVGYDASYNASLITEAKLVAYNMETKSVSHSIIIVPIGSTATPANLERNDAGNKLFYGAGFGFEGIYNFDVHTLTVSTEPITPWAENGFSIDPLNGNIWALGDNGTNGTLTVYSNDGLESEIKNKIVGRYPGEVIFNRQ